MATFMMQTQPIEKQLRNEERIGIAPASVIFTSLANSHNNPQQSAMIKGEEREQISQLHTLMKPTLSAHAQQVSIDIFTEGSRGDVGNDIIGATFLHALKQDPRFRECNLAVRMLENPYPVNDTSRVPNDTARNMFEGALSFLCTQNNMLGLCGSRAVLSFSLLINADGSPDKFALSATATPGSLQYIKKLDSNGSRLLGSSLSKQVMQPYNGHQAQVLANCYGLTQRPDTLDADGMVQVRLPNVNVGFVDNVQVNTNLAQTVFPDSYHGILMGLPTLSNQARSMYGLVQDGSFLIFDPSTAVYKCIAQAVSQIEIPPKYALRLGFVTTSAKKAREANIFTQRNFSYINEQFGGKLNKFTASVSRVQFHDMPEDQSMDEVEVIEKKVDRLRFLIGQLSGLLGLDAVFNDDTSFKVDALNGEPSTLYRTMYDKMLNMQRDEGLSKYAYDQKDVAVGYNYNNFICDKVTAEVASGKACGRNASAITIFGAHVTTGFGTIVDAILKGEIRGVVPGNPSGDKEFGWDTVFDFETFTDEYGRSHSSGGKTYASLPDDILAQTKPRAIAVRKLIQKILAYICGNEVNAETYIAQSQEQRDQVQERMEAKVNVFKDLFSSGQISVTPTQPGSKVSGSTVTSSGSNMAAIMAAFS
jgi:inosine/xanthosine triphosphate pyrophosphatase family protein